MSVVRTAAMEEADRPPAAQPTGRRQVIAIVAIGYLAAAGAMIAALLIPAR